MCCYLCQIAINLQIEREQLGRNEYIKYINEVLRDDDYRMLLQCKYSKFMDKEWGILSEKLNC